MKSQLLRYVRIPCRRSRLSILIYHRVLQEPDPLLPSEPIQEQFEQQMSLLSRKFTPLPLSEAVDGLATGSLPAKAVCVTFDDGYADNLHIAKPILDAWRIPATVFVATDYLDGGVMWNDRIVESIRRTDQTMLDLRDRGLSVFQLSTEKQRMNAVGEILQRIKHLSQQERELISLGIQKKSRVTSIESPMLSSGELRSLSSNLVSIGAHTCSHPILATLAQADAEGEILQSKLKLENAIGKGVDLFAYPNGQAGVDFERDHMKMVRQAGFKCAVSTDRGCSSKESNVFALPRFTPWDKDIGAFEARLRLNTWS